MSLNKTVALLIVGLFLVEVLPAPAAAQTGNTTDFDLEIIGLTVVDPVTGAINQPRNGVDTTISFQIINHGPDPVTGSNYRVFLGWNSAADQDCIQPTKSTNQQVAGQGVSAGGVGGVSHLGQDCYVSVDSSNGPIAANESKPFHITWNPSQTGTGTIFAQLESGTNTASDGSPPSGGNGPFGNVPDPNHPQNDRSTLTVTVGYAQVRAKPFRAAPAHSPLKPNEPWTYDELRNSPRCTQSTTVVTTTGCIGKPGTYVTFQYNVTNEGNVPDTYTASIIGDTNFVPSSNPDARPEDKARGLQDRGYKFFLPNPVKVNPHQEVVQLVTVFIPDTELVNYQMNGDNMSSSAATKVRWTSTEINPAVSTHTNKQTACPSGGDADQHGYCDDQTLPSILIGPRYRFNFTSEEKAEPVFVGIQRDFNLTINNTGNAFDTFNVTIDPDHGTINGSWNPEVPIGQVSIAAGKSANLSVRVRAPGNATLGRYSFDARVISLGDVAGQYQNFTFYADLQQQWGNTLGASFDSNLASVAAAQVASFVLNVSNANGNGPDNATIDVNNPLGWPYTISTNVVKLAPFGYANVYVNMTPPAATAAGTEGYLHFNITSEGPKDKPLDQRQKIYRNVHATVRNAPNLETTVPVPSAFVDAGKNTTYTVQVRNTGNLASAIDATITRGDIAWVATVDPPTLSLAPLESGAFTVTLRAPQTAEVGDSTKAFLTLTPAADTGAAQTVTLEGRASGPDLTIGNVLPNSTAPYTGDMLGIDVVVANVGNRAPPSNVTLRLVFVQNGVEKIIGTHVYNGSELPGNRRLSQHFDWDTSGIEGGGLLVARVDPENTIKEIDDSPASNEASRALTLRVFDLTITPAQSLSGHPGELVTYAEAPNAFIVTYRGNQPTESVQILLESEHGWIPEGSSIFLELPRLTPIAINAKVLIPTAPGVASDVLRASVIPTLRPDSVITASTTTLVLDDEKPLILGATVSPAEPVLGKNVTLTVHVQDATGVTKATAILVTPGNDTQTVALTRGAGDAWTVTQPFATAGRWRVLIQATDGADPANVNRTTSPVIEFNVTPGSAPNIALASGQSAVVRTGSFVKLDITDPLGIAGATYTVRGVSYQMSRPFSIDTSSFTSGVVDVSVSATNIYGAVTTSKITLTIKNTPPGISRVVVTPEAPKAGQDVTVKVSTDPDVQSVQVLIKKGGQVVDTRTATRGPSGSYDVTFNPQEGDYTLDVTAKDAAGNTKLQEGAVVFSARTGNALPAPGLGLVALVVVGAALLAARKKK